MRTIEVVPYDVAWRDRFENLATEMRELLGEEVISIHHIGSTAVPDLAAKPIVDLLLAVREIEHLDAYNEEMEAQGYLPRGEYGIPGRRYFIKGSEEQRLAHVHAYEQGDPALVRHLAFRDYLRAHPEKAAGYGHLKQKLAREHPHAIEAYIAGKRAMVQQLEAEALAWYD